MALVKKWLGLRVLLGCELAGVVKDLLLDRRLVHLVPEPIVPELARRCSSKAGATLTGGLYLTSPACEGSGRNGVGVFGTLVHNPPQACLFRVDKDEHFPERKQQLENLAKAILGARIFCSNMLTLSLVAACKGRVDHSKGQGNLSAAWLLGSVHALPCRGRGL